MAKYRLIKQALVKLKGMTGDEWPQIERQRPDDLDDAIEILDELRGQSAPPPAPPTGDQQDGRERTVRRLAISEVVAHLAASLPDVVRFRQTALGDQLIDADVVAAWIDRQRRGAGAFTDLRLLPFTLPDDDRTHFQLVARGGVLDALSILGHHLADAYGWKPVEGVMFVLTGRVPAIADFTAVAARRPALPALNRLVLTVDPALTPIEVARAYQRLRLDEFGGRRFRNLSEKHVQLGSFAVQRPGDERWEERRQAWNEQCVREGKRKWRYLDGGKFKRDCDLARQRLLRLDDRPVEVHHG